MRCGCCIIRRLLRDCGRPHLGKEGVGQRSKWFLLWSRVCDAEEIQMFPEAAKVLLLQSKLLRPDV